MNNYTTLTRYKAATPRSARRQKGYTVPTISLPSGNSVSLGGVVMLSGEQTITSIKDFLAGIKIGGLPIYKSKADTIYFDCNLVVRGGITAFGTNETITASIFDALPIDGVTLKRTENGVLYVASGGSGGSGGGDGISIEDLESYLTANGYATQSWVTGKGYITASASITGNAGTATSAQYLYQSNIQESINYPRGVDHAIKVVNCTSIKQDGFFSDYTTVLSVASPLSNFQFGMYANPFATWASRPRFRAMRNTDGMRTDWKELAYYEDIPTNTNQLTNGAGFITASASITGNAATANRLIEEVVTDLNKATVGRIFTMTSGYGSTDGNKPTTGWVTGLTLQFAQNGVYRRQLAYSDDFFVRDENNGSWGKWRKILTSTNFYDYALPITGGAISGDLEIYGSVYSSGGNLRIKARNSIAVGVEIAVSDTDFWQISHRGSFANNELHFYHNANGTWSKSVLSLISDGSVIVGNNLLAKGGVTATNSSDRRLKKNIRKFNASKVLMSLGAVWEYEYIDSEVQKNHIYGGTHYGLIYQHVKGTKLDVMCHEREDGFGTLNYIHPKFISLIAGATMENTSEIEKLKRKIRYLEAKVKQLESRA